MYSNVAGSVFDIDSGLIFETDCELGEPAGFAYPRNAAGICTEAGSPNIPVIPSASVKAGILAPGDFSGTPLIAIVAFENSFEDVEYSISLSGVDARIFNYQSKTINGFVINTNADAALSGEVSWIATPIGET